MEDSFVGSLIKDYEDVFQPISPSLPPKRKIAYTIPLKEGHKAPIRLIYRLILLEIEEAKGKIAEYIHKRWLEPSSSSYVSPTLFIKKKDGGLTSNKL